MSEEPESAEVPISPASDQPLTVDAPAKNSSLFHRDGHSRPQRFIKTPSGALNSIRQGQQENSFIAKLPFNQQDTQRLHRQGSLGTVSLSASQPVTPLRRQVSSGSIGTRSKQAADRESFDLVNRTGQGENSSLLRQNSANTIKGKLGKESVLRKHQSASSTSVGSQRQKSDVLRSKSSSVNWFQRENMLIGQQMDSQTTLAAGGSNQSKDNMNNSNHRSSLDLNVTFVEYFNPVINASASTEGIPSTLLSAEQDSANVTQTSCQELYKNDYTGATYTDNDRNTSKKTERSGASDTNDRQSQDLSKQSETMKNLKVNSI